MLDHKNPSSWTRCKGDALQSFLMIIKLINHTGSYYLLFQDYFIFTEMTPKSPQSPI